MAYCAKPGTAADECGAKVPEGLKLKFGILLQSGAVITSEEMDDLKSQANQVGIDLVLTEAPFPQVVGHLINCGPGGEAKPSSPKCSWTALNWGAGWIYAPDYEPTGEALFYTGAGADYSGYSSPEADHLIALTTTAPASQSKAAIDNYEDYMAQQLPVVFQPTATGSPTSASVDLISQHLGGYINNVYFNLTPETWYLTK